MTKLEIKTAIQNLEYIRNGFLHIAGAGVGVVNIRTLKDIVKADVKLVNDGVTTKIPDCEYPYKVLEAVLEEC